MIRDTPCVHSFTSEECFRFSFFKSFFAGVLKHRHNFWAQTKWMVRKPLRAFQTVTFSWGFWWGGAVSSFGWVDASLMCKLQNLSNFFWLSQDGYFCQTGHRAVNVEANHFVSMFIANGLAACARRMSFFPFQLLVIESLMRLLTASSFHLPTNSRPHEGCIWCQEVHQHLTKIPNTNLSCARVVAALSGWIHAQRPCAGLPTWRQTGRYGKSQSGSTNIGRLEACRKPCGNFCDGRSRAEANWGGVLITKKHNPGMEVRLKCTGYYSDFSTNHFLVAGLQGEVQVNIDFSEMRKCKMRVKRICSALAMAEASELESKLSLSFFLNEALPFSFPFFSPPLGGRGKMAELRKETSFFTCRCNLASDSLVLHDAPIGWNLNLASEKDCLGPRNDFCASQNVTLFFFAFFRF